MCPCSLWDFSLLGCANPSDPSPPGAVAGCWGEERVCWLKIGNFLGFLDGIPEGNGAWGDAGTSREGQDGCVRGCGIDQVYQGLIRIRVRILSVALLEHRI